MGATAQTPSDEESARTRDAYWRVTQRYDDALNTLRGVYHSDTLDPAFTEIIEAMFSEHDQPL